MDSSKSLRPSNLVSVCLWLTSGIHPRILPKLTHELPTHLEGKMARKLRDTELDTAAARSRLSPRPEPYWRRISRTCHLGYRRNRKSGGAWVGRFYTGERYVKEVLAVADDVVPANGVNVLSFDQVQEKARAWFDQQARRAAGLGEVEEVGPYTVAQCMKDYLNWFAVHRKGISPTKHRIEAHILPALGNRIVTELSSRDLRRWHQSLAASPARVRSSVGGPVRYRELPEEDDPEAARRRKASANRVLTVLKAALNHAYSEGLVASDEAWRRVKPFRAVEAAKIRYLSLEEIVQLCNGCDPHFRRLVQGALLTGARYGELIAFRVGDYSRDGRALLVRDSKSGKPRSIFLNAEGVEFFDQVTAGRTVGSLIFLRSDGKAWGRSQQKRRLEDACRTAKLTEVSFHILRHTYASQLAMKGVPLPVIAAQLGHADTRMTQKHYAHLAPSYVADVVRASLPTFGIVERSKITRLVAG